jgi:hypothetical protein
MITIIEIENGLFQRHETKNGKFISGYTFNRDQTATRTVDGVEESYNIYDDLVEKGATVTLLTDDAKALHQSQQLIQQLTSQLIVDLESITHEFSDGRVIQVRPSDVAILEIAISRGNDKRWKMADNTISMMAISELQAALIAGLEKGEAIWDDYTLALS